MRFKRPSFLSRRRYEAANNTIPSRGRCSAGDELYKNFDRGNLPTVLDLDAITAENANYRTALWTGEGMQLTVMCIPAGGDIGEEIHYGIDQFIRIESGEGEVIMTKGENSVREKLGRGDAIIIPRATRHNVVNTGRYPLKLYSLYTPPKHPYGTVQATKDSTERAE